MGVPSMSALVSTSCAEALDRFPLVEDRLQAPLNLDVCRPPLHNLKMPRKPMLPAEVGSVCLDTAACGPIQGGGSDTGLSMALTDCPSPQPHPQPTPMTTMTSVARGCAIRRAGMLLTADSFNL
jgi:hypothetical protein